MKKLVIVSILLTAFSAVAGAEEAGSLYISRLSSGFSWEGNKTGATIDSIFTIVIDGKTRVRVSKDRDAKIENLNPDKKHSVAVYLDGKRIESFFFSFKSYRCRRLWLYYKGMYGTWVLREAGSCSRV